MKSNHMIAIVYGWIVTIVLLLIASAFLALAIRWMIVTKDNMYYTSLIIGLFILFISGVITGLKGKERGWLLGATVGFGFMGVTFLLQYIGLNEAFTIQQTVYQLTYVLAAIVGSVIGVNLANRS